jgi:hypothetical protein
MIWINPLVEFSERDLEEKRRRSLPEPRTLSIARPVDCEFIFMTIIMVTIKIIWRKME